jgi:hypothetical protein
VSRIAEAFIATPSRVANAHQQLLASDVDSASPNAGPIS